MGWESAQILHIFLQCRVGLYAADTGDLNKSKTFPVKKDGPSDIGKVATSRMLLTLTCPFGGRLYSNNLARPISLPISKQYPALLRYTRRNTRLSWLPPNASVSKIQNARLSPQHNICGSAISHKHGEPRTSVITISIFPSVKRTCWLCCRAHTLVSKCHKLNISCQAPIASHSQLGKESAAAARTRRGAPGLGEFGGRILLADTDEASKGANVLPRSSLTNCLNDP